MANNHHIIKAVQAALEHEPRINLHTHPVTMRYEDDVLTLEGEAQDIAAKKLTMGLAIATPGVTGIVDRLHVTPAVRIGDGAILRSVRDVLLQDPALQNCALRIRNKGKVETIREAATQTTGAIELSVTDGVVLLDDHVPSLAKKRLAGVLAWWVPGSRDVVNGMAVEPPEEDNDEELLDTVHLVLTKDPLVQADQIRVGTKQSIVTLEGLVSNEVQRRAAENDAWFVFGVDKVVNHLKVQE
ncbi:MAG TPA: BON domain-containing protein [Nitrospirales bacterium]|nr:transporter [Nitrospiraceae bacterium]HNP31247.1 BON domain-containing protein [Nitrospirales bacterium]